MPNNLFTFTRTEEDEGDYNIIARENVAALFN